ncbi:MAG: DUF3737 family protein [Acholeplasmatales bacterium]|nr:DUF3737 family protein [Acholeplasmatales bacterium]
MKEYRQELLTGERAMYNTHGAVFYDTTFSDGESPLKESSEIELRNCIFKWKYPLWYSKNIKVFNTTWLDTARSGIWYTDNIYIKDSFIEAPKQFRRSKNITIENTMIPNAEEFLWSCENITMKNVQAKGHYFGMNSSNIKIDNFTLAGNYAFDGAKNIEIRNAKMNSKDSFWNCENVIIYDSTIIGEYLGWNSKNITLINCTIDSNQGMCYMDGIKMINCKLLNTDLSFELCSDVDAVITTKIDSVKNPKNGRIEALSIGEVILDDNMIDPKKTTIITKE